MLSRHRAKGRSLPKNQLRVDPHSVILLSITPLALGAKRYSAREDSKRRVPLLSDALFTANVFNAYRVAVSTNYA